MPMAIAGLDAAMARVSRLAPSFRITVYVQVLLSRGLGPA